MSNPAQVIRPPNTLRMKVGGSFGGIDAGAIAKAEQALQAMSSQFGQWLQDELVKLDQAQADIRASGYNATTAEALYFRAHDLKGLGSTYQYPLVTRLAGSLCKMMDDPAKIRCSILLPVQSVTVLLRSSWRIVVLLVRCRTLLIFLMVRSRNSRLRKSLQCIH